MRNDMQKLVFTSLIQNSLIFQMKFAAYLLLFGLYFISSFPLNACMCERMPEPIRDARDYDIIFSGIAIQKRPVKLQKSEDKPWADTEVVFELDKLIVGQLKTSDKRLTISTRDSGSVCGYTFSIGTKYIVFGNRKKGRTNVYMCSPTLRYDSDTNPESLIKRIRLAREPKRNTKY